MAIDGRESRSSCQGGGLFKRNVEVSAWVSVLFGDAEVNKINLVRILASSNKDVVRLQVTMNEVF